MRKIVYILDMKLLECVTIKYLHATKARVLGQKTCSLVLNSYLL